MLPMALSSNDRRLLIQLFMQMATNKEASYNETLHVISKLGALEKVIGDDLMGNHEDLETINEQVRIAIRTAAN